MRKLCLKTLAGALCLLFLACYCQAQFRASLRGVVTDPQGALVQGATVTLLNTQTNASMKSVTDDNGIYVFNGLPSVPFRITVTQTGFKEKVIEKVQIIPEQLNSLNLQLELGQVQESVVVSGTTETLDTETATVSGTIRSEQIQNMPSFGRDVFQLLQLAPGMLGDGAQGRAGSGANLPGTQGPGATGGSQGIFQTENGPQALAIGQQYENNGISIDGISTTSAVWGGTTIITPSEESVDNVKVVSNNYDAELGRFSGAQIQIATKSGTNQYHGSFFFTAHRPGLNAKQPFNGNGNQDLRDDNLFNQFGGSVGGPIWKNKIFAFFAYETVRTPAGGAPQHQNGWFETSAIDGAARQNSIAQKYLTFPGSAPNVVKINNDTCAEAGLVENVTCRTIPGQGLDIGSPLTAPLGTQDPGFTSATNPGLGSGLDGVADIANFFTTSRNASTKVQYNGRLDADLTQKDHLAFTSYWVPQSTSFLNGPARAYNQFNHSQINQALALIWNRTLTPTFVNEFRVNGAGWRWNEISSNPQAPVGLPRANIDTTGSITVQNFGPSVGSILDQWTYSLKDVATKVLGRHTVKFGVDATRLYYLNACIGCGVPNYGFFNLWDFLNDAPHQESSGFNPTTGFPSSQRQDDRENIFAFFVQDDFKLRRNLTLNLGLRYSYFGPLYSKEGNMFVATPGAGSAYMTGLTVKKGDAWNPQKNNFGPEIGFAWSPERFQNRLVVRGGYGLNYSQEEIAISGNIQTNPGLIVFPTFSMPTPSSPNPGIVYATSSDLHALGGYPSNPNAIVNFGSNGLPVNGTGFNVGIFPNSTLPTMRVHHFSLDTQYDLGHALIATLGYQGSISHNLYFHESPNALPASEGFQLNPQVGGGDYWSLLGYANYNAMIAGLRHRFTHQFQADAQFTWAKSMDTSSGPYFEQPYVANVHYNYGRSDYDVAKAFKLYGMWQPVIFRGQRGWLEKVVGGWTLSPVYNIHTGFPWTPLIHFGGSLYCASCGYGTVFPAAYLGGAGNSTSNDAFKTGANYSKGGPAYFSTPTFLNLAVPNFGNPPAPGVGRNTLNGPGYKDVDLSLIKAFGLPLIPVLGENAKLEFRVDAYNLFNNLNFKPGGQNIGGSIIDNINAVGFGRATEGLAGRVVTLGARFNF